MNRARRNEGGWALLGLILALTILSIMMAAAVPDVQTQVRREKEEEMIYRGMQMAEAIARYYNRGRLGYLQINVPPPYGYLTDLKKLRDGVMLGVNELKFVRPSALIDPMSGQEWEPVRIRDPRLLKAFEAYAAANQVPIPPSYYLLAAPPANIGLGQTPTEVAAPQPAEGRPPAIGRPDAGQRRRDRDEEDEDEGDEGIEDPIMNLPQLDKNNLPIIGVAPRVKGRSIKSLWGLNDYEDWVFIYIPPVNVLQAPPVPQEIGPGQRPRVSQ